MLIYLLLAEHAIEIVADRGLAQRVPEATWHTLVQRLGQALRAGQYEDGLTEVLADVSALLVAHFPASDNAPSSNELPDAPVLL